MYLSTSHPRLFHPRLGEPVPKAAPSLTKDAQQRNAAVAKTMTAALQLATDAKPFLKTDAQKQLLELIIAGLQTFFPTGFGTADQKNVIVNNSTRLRYETMVQDPKNLIMRPYLYDVRLFMTDEPSKTRRGQHWSIGTHASRIDLFARNLTTSRPNELVGTGIHEMIHMLRSMLRSFEERFGPVPTRRFPSSSLAAILTVKTFANDHKKLEVHFKRLVNFLERDSGQRFDEKYAGRIAELAIEEVMAFVFSKRVELAIAVLDSKRMAARTGAGVGVAYGFVPTEFVKSYIRRHWFQSESVQKSLQKPEIDRIINDMSADVQSLATAMESQIGQ